MAFRFLDLPPELRNTIYGEVLHPVYFREDIGDGHSRYKFDLSLFHVNRQIHDEARKTFFRNFLFIRIETPWDESQDHVKTEGHVPIVCSGYAADLFQDHCLGVAIGAPRSGTLDRDPRKFLLLLDDLASFCKMWFYSDLSWVGELNKNLRLTLSLRSPHTDLPGQELPLALQQRLLLPFGAVKKLREVQVDGPHSEKLCQQMRDEMQVPQNSPEECLDEAIRLKDLGNEALRKGSPQKALDLYLQSFHAMHIVCNGRYRNVWGDEWFDRILRGGAFDGQHGLIVRITLRVRLVANVVKAYLDMRNYVEAEFWGERTIGLLRRSTGSDEDEPLLDFPAAKEMGKIYYRTGLACKMLGKTYEARKLFRVAHVYLPSDESVKRELASVSFLLV